MATIESLQKQYRDLDRRIETKTEVVIDRECLLAFDYEYSGQDTEVVTDMNEFTAVCPWTGLPDFGSMVIKYVPDRLCLELKSLKYYLLSYTGVGIVQEHAANRILNDLVVVCQPVAMTVTLDYNVRGGLHTTVTANYEKE
jgi:7-cyano-7-deazaguanine reductase